MKKSSNYNLFLFLSSFTRGLIEIFSLVLLFKKGFSVEEIMFGLFIMYVVGIAVNYISLKINSKMVLILSCMLYGISYFYLSVMGNKIGSLIILSILLSMSNYSYHSVRHLLALETSDKNNSTNKIILFMYLGIILSSIMGIFINTKTTNIIGGIVVLVLSFLSNIPILRLSLGKGEKKGNGVLKVKIGRDKILFSIFEQFKVIFLELQPLFLYLYVSDSLYYVGIFNIIVNIASLVVVYFIVKRVRLRDFKYYCFILGIVFLLKLFLNSGAILLGVAFLEGIFVKIYENTSLGNLYDLGDNDVHSYLILEECIFFITKSILMGIFILLNLKLRAIMYICIVGIVVSGLFIKDKNRT